MTPDENNTAGGSPNVDPSATAQHAAREAKGAARDVRDAATGVVSDVRDEAYRLGSSLKERAREQIERRKDGVAHSVEGVAEEAHRSAERLREHSPFLADLVERGVTEVRNVARTIETQDLDSFVSSLERFARQKPALFMAASVTVGLIGARLLQSSPRREGDGYGARHMDEYGAHRAGEYDPRYPSPTEPRDVAGLHEERYPAGRITPPEPGTATPGTSPDSIAPGGVP
jgi:hypothetical protein